MGYTRSEHFLSQDAKEIAFFRDLESAKIKSRTLCLLLRVRIVSVASQALTACALPNSATRYLSWRMKGFRALMQNPNSWAKVANVAVPTLTVSALSSTNMSSHVPSSISMTPGSSPLNMAARIHLDCGVSSPSASERPWRTWFTF